MSDAPSFPTLPVLDTHAAPEGAAAGGVVHDLALGVPRRIGPYEITGVLGSGGMGVVYRAEQHEPLRREVALKLIRRGLAHALLRAEADRAWARVSAATPSATADRHTAGDTR